LAHGAGELFHAGRGFFQVAGGLLGARAQVLVARGNLGRRRVDAVGRAAQLRTMDGKRWRMLSTSVHQAADLVLRSG
jgi:hypothetical protein